MAYLDPLSGSILLQALVAGLLGALLTVKKVSTSIRGWFTRLWSRLRG